jgi:hypothetical protein
VEVQVVIEHLLNQVAIGTVITITVGDGGAGVTSAFGNNGSNSSISGSGLTTITSAGGGAGARYGATSPNQMVFMEVQEAEEVL